MAELFQEEWMPQLQKLSIDSAREAVAEYRKRVLREQIDKARSVVKEYSSKDGGSGIITLLPRTNNTVRMHTLLAVTGAASGLITITLGDDALVFPQQATGFLFFDNLDFSLGRGDVRRLAIATPGAPLFFGLWGEQVGDAQAIA